jgi:hypothetical protein
MYNITIQTVRYTLLGFRGCSQIEYLKNKICTRLADFTGDNGGQPTPDDQSEVRNPRLTLRVQEVEVAQLRIVHRRRA